MRVYNILWDTDTEEEAVGLPDEIEVPDTIRDLDDIDEYITNVTGFCNHKHAKGKGNT